MFQLFEPVMLADKAPRWANKVAVHYPLLFGFSPFAHLFICSQDKTQFAIIVTEYPELISLNPRNLDDFKVAILGSQSLQEDFFNASDARHLEAQLGPLGTDECYYPAPYPALGGSGELSSYKRGNVWVHLDIYAQTIGI